MSLIAALCGVAVVGGIWLAADGWARVPIRARAPRRPRTCAGQHRASIAAIAALAVLVVTRWPIAAVAGGALGWVVTGVSGRRELRDAERRTEAIALWAEMLRDAIGTARGVEGILVATASTAPLPIRSEVEAMARRLQREPLDLVLDDLAMDLAHPIGDLVVTALRLTSTAGGRQVRDVLGNLAAAAYAEAESRRRVEVARERPRAAMRYTAIVIGGFVTLLVLFSRSYLEPYDSPAGQVVLVFVGCYWAAGFWWMSRMGRTPPPPRLFTDQGTPS